MPELLALATSGNGVLKRIDRFLSSFSRIYLLSAVLALQGALFYAYYQAGPLIPLGVFYLLNLYLAAKYVGARFSYLLAFAAAAGKAMIKVHSYPVAAEWWQGEWQFVSSYSIYTLFCYLINAQLGARRQAEAALDELFRLNEAIVAHADSGILVFGGNGRCLIANEAAAKILGCSLERIWSFDLANDEIWPAQELLRAGRDTMRSGVSKKFVARLGRSGDKESWCVVAVGRVTRAEKSYLLLLFTDISDYKAAEEAKRQADYLAAQALRRAGQAERELVGIGEQTQQRIGRELHDDLGQHLTGIAFLAEVLSQKLQDAGRTERQDADKVVAMLNQAIAKTRHLAHGLYPSELDEQDICRKLTKFASHVEAMYQVGCVFECSTDFQAVTPDVAVHLFRITQEAVNNAVRHGHAGHIILRMSTQPAALLFEILDDGCGFERNAVKFAEGLGMRSMRYRADLFGGNLEVANRPEGGVRVAVSMSRP